MERIAHTPMIQVTLPWLEEAVTAKCRPFYSHREGQPGCQFSNLYPAAIALDTSQYLDDCEETLLFEGRGICTFPSTENAFQCAKACDELHVDFVLALDPLNAARAGQGRLKMNKRQRELYESLGGKVVRKGSGKRVKFLISDDARYPRRAGWETLKKRVMALALEAKFLQHPELWTEYVEASEMTFLIEHTENDGQWGDLATGEGTNFLGKMLTALLWETRTGQVIDRRDAGFQVWLHAANIACAPGFYLGEEG